jgi:hypothetical protein
MSSCLHAYANDSSLAMDKGKDTFEFIGKAYDKDSGKLLYSEQHRIFLNEAGHYQRAEVTYRDQDNLEFAKKHLSYDKWATVPSTLYQELSGPFYYEVLPNDESIKLNYQDEEQQTSDVLALNGEELFVVDAGFDRLVSEHWDFLLTSEPLVFSFLAVTRSQFYDFRLVMEGLEEDGQRVVFKLEPDNRLLRWLLEPMYLTYQLNTQRLVRFEGLTNVRKRMNGQATDENYTAVIQYDYL